MAEKHVTVKVALSPLPCGRFRSRIEDSPSGASAGVGTDFDLPAATEGGFPDFIKAVDSGTRSQKELEELGRQLFTKIFAESVGEALTAARALARERDAFLRLAISALSPELVRVPWEYLHDGKNYLLKQPKIHIVRILDQLPQEMAPFRPFGTLLIAVANPRTMPRFVADEHVQKLQGALAAMGARASVVLPATQASLLAALNEEDFDAFYFLGHGHLDPNDGGVLFLEDKNGLPDAISGASLAQWLRIPRRPIFFAYLNSCYAGAADNENSFSGVAQRLLADGPVPAVVAQQAPVPAEPSMKVAEAFLNGVRRGESPEAAMTYARAQGRNVTWGIPVLYTHLRGPEEFERNRLKCLLSHEINGSRYGIVMGRFAMGVNLEGQGSMTADPRGTYTLPASPTPISVTVNPPETYVFSGDTYAREDVESAADVLGLVLRVAHPSDVGFYKSAEDHSAVSHWFLFGSRSNKIVASVLQNYSPRFNFRYTEAAWFLEELDAEGKVIEPINRITAPNHLDWQQYEQHEDLGIIEKITDADNKRVFLIIAGLGSRATRGCGWYLARRWENIVNQVGGNDFGIILHFPAGLPFDHPKGVEIRRARSAREGVNKVT